MQAFSSPSYVTSAVECPNCGKHSIVSHREGAYHCLNCDFERILNRADSNTRSEDETNNPFTATFGVVIFVMTLLLFL